MGRLKVLPANLANMIAAGEVVQRPGSVVKELMENAVDAGATQLTVVITDAGRTMIQVIDNGCGMSPADAVLCFERHATSKIAEPEDLEAILTYGFRGEALPSIAAVSEVTLKTRRKEDETATKVTVSGSGEVRASEVSAPLGTSFTVRNLFYNTPARRKFLKSDSVEFKHIVEEFTRVAITRPEIGFSLSHNGREVYVLKPAKSLKFRIMDLLGTTVAGDLVDIDAKTTVASISGFIGRPDTARKTLGNQYFFVQGRFFRSAYLHKAVMKAYEEMIPDGLTPSYFIFLDVDPHSVDVNIHPTKTEVKFEDESVLFQIIYACVKETLGRSSFGASIDFEAASEVQMPQLGRSFEEYRGGTFQPAADFDPNYNPFDPDGVSGNAAPAAGPGPGWSAPKQDFGGYVHKTDDYGKLFEQKSVAASKAFVIQGRYIVTPVASGLMLISIRRAWERILYERALKALGSADHVTQAALFPVQVQVGVQNRLILDDNADLLSQLGFDISPFGNDTVVVGGVPEGYSCEPGKVQQMVFDLILILSDGRSALPEVMRQNMAEKFATLGAVNHDVPSGPVEAQQLIDTLFACENAELTSGGKRIVSILPAEEIDRRF